MKTPQFLLTVTTTDDGPGNQSGSATVTVNFVDEDEAPVVHAETFNVVQGSSNGTHVGTVTASQIDAGQSVAFAITAGNTNNVFAIDAGTGQIMVANAAQLGGASTSYALTVQATDDTTDMLSGSATVTITVNDAASGVDAAQMEIDVIAASSEQIVYRVNAGGSPLSGTPAWAVDTHANPSPHHNTDTRVYSTSHAIDLSHSSIPAGTPQSLFQTERYSSASNPLSWDFAVTPGDYEVRLYFADIYTGTHAVGARVFDVSIEGAQVLDNYDIFATVGGWAGVVESFVVSSDSNLDIDFAHVVENPAIKAIEILQLA